MEFDIKDMNINYKQFKLILEYFKNYDYEFINKNNQSSNQDLKFSIKNSIELLFPNINKTDSEILYLFTENLIEKISLYMYFKNEDKYYEQWKQNNFRDIKGVILLLLPFIDDKNNGKLQKDMVDLNQFLYAKLKKEISLNLLEENRNDVLKTDFKFSNMAIGLLNSDNVNNLLELFEKDNEMKLIYKIIHHNYLGILKTLEIMNGKYYINWINIIPLEDFSTSELYLKTIEGLNKFKNVLVTKNKTLINSFFNDYYGLWFGDIYNVIKIKLYEEVKQIKFLFFNFRGNNQNYYLIKYLGETFNFDMFFKYESFEDLPENEQNNFYSSLKMQIQEVGRWINFFEIWKQILLFLCNNYSLKLIVQSENQDIFKKFYFITTLKQSDFTDEDNIDEDFSRDIINIINQITQEDVMKFLKEINPKHIWNFLLESIKKLQGTYLKDYFIIKKDGRYTISNDYYFPGTNNKLSFKNIYNIAKSITHYTEGRIWKSFEPHYISFSLDNQIKFFERFLNVEIFSSWLNLTKNIQREHGNVNYNLKLGEIYNAWDQIIRKLIFEILNKNGLLNKFDVTLDITDKKRYIVYNSGEIGKRLGEKIKKTPYFKKSYYYLTNDTFENLPKMEVEGKKEEVEYFELFKNTQNWYSFYAMDWLSQINFFHHYLNHRILYVTGATGQGKSTQVPKLLMYALKVYEYKNNGKVICTQPRRTPTQKNAERIAFELGLPIIKPSENPIKFKKNNFYVQMKHAKDSHIKNNCPHLTLKILTDGTLYEEIISNPLLKETIFNKGKKDYMYGFNNYYDIIILDESHEHNTNMDMILTLLRQSCMYNNSIRLIIMSATMDEDEPIYRSYFQCVNDNLLYPLKAPLYQHPIPTIKINELENKIIPERCYMDRRFHISPPGETTQYIVTEEYMQDDRFDKMEDKKGSDSIEEKSYEKIIEICNKYSTGEILLFANGAAEIQKAVEYLNIHLPAGNVALPYYADLNQSYKDIIEEIGVKIKLIRNRRENIYKEWLSDYIQDPSVPEGIYQRAIIIATNVAEASITIKTLKFVVDNGYAKVNIFDENSMLTKLGVEKISEASRLQRKGRVGRTSDGTVYYLYPRGAREKILPKYKITQDNLNDLVLKLLVDEEFLKNIKKENDNIIPSNYDPNLYDNDESLIYDKYRKINRKFENEFFTKNIYDIVLKQYSIEGQIIDPKLYWNVKYFSMKKLDDISLKRVFKGQLPVNLMDLRGNFYIIHPFENKIERNICNHIIKYQKIKLNEIPPIYFQNYFDILQNKLVAIEPDFDPDDIYNLTKPKNIFRTNLYEKILNFQKNLSEETFDVNDYLILFTSIGLNCLNEVLAVLVMIKVFLSKNIFTKENEKNFNNKWSNPSEIIMLFNIYNSLKSHFLSLKVFNLNDLSPYNNYINDLRKSFEKEKKFNPKDFPVSFKNKEDLWNTLSKLYYSGNLNNSIGENELKYEFVKKDIYDEKEKNSDNFKEWARKNYIDPDFISDFLNKMTKLTIDILTIERNLDVNLKEESPLKWIINIQSSFRKVLRGNSIEEKILKSFIIGKPLNYAFKKETGNKIYDLSTIKKKGIINNKNMNNFLYYYNYTDTKIENIVELKITNAVELDYFTSTIPHIFNKRFFKNQIQIIIPLIENDKLVNKLISIKIKGDIYDMIINYVNNNSLTASPWETDELPYIKDYMKKLRK